VTRIISLEESSLAFKIHHCWGEGRGYLLSVQEEPARSIITPRHLNIGAGTIQQLCEHLLHRNLKENSEFPKLIHPEYLTWHAYK